MISDKLRFAIFVLRDRCTCRRCGREVDILDYSLHHRRGKGMGGSRYADAKGNLVTLCGSGTTGCHGWVTEHPAESYEQGWMVRRNSIDDPEAIPMLDIHGRQFFLTDSGCVIYVNRAAS